MTSHSVNHERHPLLETHLHEFDCGPMQGLCVDGVGEGGAIPEHLVSVEGDLPQKMAKAAPAKRLRFHPCDVGKESTVCVEGIVPLPDEHLDASIEIFLRQL